MKIEMDMETREVILRVPERHILDVIEVIRLGMGFVTEAGSAVDHLLTDWCDDNARYFSGQANPDQR